MVSVDFFTVPTVRFQILYVFLVLARDRRRIIHFAVTAHPTAEWTAQQMRESFPWESAPQYLLRDRDRIFGKDFVDQMNVMGIKQVLDPQFCSSPWIFGAPQIGLSRLIVRISTRTSPGTFGRPGRQRRIFHVQNMRNP